MIQFLAQRRKEPAASVAAEYVKAPRPLVARGFVSPVQSDSA
jgi:hypothetical protein